MQGKTLLPCVWRDLTVRGFRGVLTKPFLLEDVAEVMRRVVAPATA
jgi:hypothetical protein